MASSSSKQDIQEIEPKTKGNVKKSKKLPVHIVEDHHDALYHILRCIGSKRLPFSDNMMVHFDSHPDLLLPPDLESSHVCNLSVLMEKLSIENWILPAAYGGHFSTIVWVKPFWSNQIDNGLYKFFIGNLKESKQIRVSSKLLYFVSEMLYCPIEELENTKEITLYVCTIDLKDGWKPDPLLQELVSKHGQNYVLDIDLDFFSTLNPFIEIYKKANMYDSLKLIYKFNVDQSNEENIISLQSQRISQITALKTVFDILDEDRSLAKSDDEIETLCSNIENAKEKERLISLIKDLYKEYGDVVDWNLVHDAGCTCDDSERVLPHNVSTDEEIEALMTKAKSFIDALPSPVVITLARSSLDDYCPPDKVDFIQHLLCSYLRKKFEIQLLLHYE